MSKWTIIYCRRHDGYSPHLNAIKISNPEHQLLVLDTANNYPAYKAWMECDLILRSNIKKNLPIIKHNNIALLEWDVLLLDNLPDIDNINNLYAAEVYYNGGPWIPAAKTHFRNTVYQNFIVCASRFCFYMMPKLALEIWTNPENDIWFEKSISCEVRIPTLCRRNGIEPVTFKKPYPIRGKDDIPSISGKNIYHPILEKLSDKFLKQNFNPDPFDSVFNTKHVI